jgi:hypothetical protein
MATRKRKKPRQQVVVYLDERDRALLERVAEKTGLAKTEIFRQGLRRFADERLSRKPGSSLADLIATAREDPFPSDVAEHHDHYLYGGGYGDRVKKGHAGSD